MLRVEYVEVFNFEGAIRGLRNPMNSWDRSDSMPGGQAGYQIGKNDLDLMRRLYTAGTEHRKYLRQIFVSMDIIAPLYWWKEFDTYKVGTVANSCSTMHKIHCKDFDINDFSHDGLEELEGLAYDMALTDWTSRIKTLNYFLHKYIKTNEKKYWRQLIEKLPSSYNQKRTITMNYENVVSMIHQRTGHKLSEWNTFVEELKELPYIKDIKGE